MSLYMHHIMSLLSNTIKKLLAIKRPSIIRFQMIFWTILCHLQWPLVIRWCLHYINRWTDWIKSLMAVLNRYAKRIRVDCVDFFCTLPNGYSSWYYFKVINSRRFYYYSYLYSTWVFLLYDYEIFNRLDRLYNYEIEGGGIYYGNGGWLK